MTYFKKDDESLRAPKGGRPDTPHHTSRQSGRRGVASRTMAAAVVGATTAAMLGLVPVAAAQSSMGSSSMGSSNHTPPVAAGQQDPFYDTSTVSPQRPGEVLRTQVAPYTRVFGTLDYNLPSTATKIMYTTTNQAGQLTPVTGYVVEPVAPWLGPGERPTIVIGRGTVGQGDQCAPSRNWPLDGQPDPISAKRLVNLEGLYDWVYANQGVRGVVTDYVGMGTPGVHTYMNRLDQAHAMIDAARAARELVTGPNAAEGAQSPRGKQGFGKVAFYGHSQGGGASAAALEEVAGYAPDLTVAAGYASAPPADLDAVQRNIDGSDLVGAIGFTINGLLERYPHLRPLLDQHLSAKGQDTLQRLSGMCTGEITYEFGYQRTNQWTKSGESLDELLKTMPEAQAAMADQYIGNGKPAAPVMIVSGRYDQNVEYKQGRDLAQHWRDQGGDVTYRDDILPPIGEYNHFAQAVSGGAFGMPFIMSKFWQAG